MLDFGPEKLLGACGPDRRTGTSHFHPSPVRQKQEGTEQPSGTSTPPQNVVVVVETPGIIITRSRGSTLGKSTNSVCTPPTTGDMRRRPPSRATPTDSHTPHAARPSTKMRRAAQKPIASRPHRRPLPAPNPPPPPPITPEPSFTSRYSRRNNLCPERSTETPATPYPAWRDATDARTGPLLTDRVFGPLGTNRAAIGGGGGGVRGGSVIYRRRGPPVGPILQGMPPTSNAGPRPASPTPSLSFSPLPGVNLAGFASPSLDPLLPGRGEQPRRSAGRDQ